MPRGAGQIPLPFRRYDDCRLEQFWPGANRHVLDHLLALNAGEGPAFTYLWGESGTGKSHLLQAMCTHAAAAGGRSVYLPLRPPRELLPESLEQLEHLDLVCIDDLECIGGDAAWEEAIFNLYNRVQEAATLVLFAASRSPNGIVITLPDLRSRLQQCVIFHLQPLAEGERLAALRQRAVLRGMDLSEDVMNYIARRVPRGTGQLFELLERLDRASLAAKKRVTVPFVRDLLEGESRGRGPGIRSED